MQDSKFGCCSSYQQCSDAGKCIKPDMMNCCNYWLSNLSHGRNFYSTKPKKNIKNGYIYLIVDDRAFRISSNSKNNYSYPLSTEEIEALSQKLKFEDVKHSLSCEEFRKEIKGSPENPAYFRVNFSSGEHIYNIKNFNGFEITEGEARELKNILPVECGAEVVRWCSTGYFKMKAPAVVKTVEKKQEVKKENVISKIIETQKEKYHQISIFEMMAAKA